MLEESTLPSNTSHTAEPSLDMTDLKQKVNGNFGNTGKEESTFLDNEVEEYVPTNKFGRFSAEDMLPQTPMTSAPPIPSPKQTPSVSARSQDANSKQAAVEEAEEPPLCAAGKVLVQFTYMPAANKVNLTVIRCQEMPEVERGGSEMIAVHLCVLPMRKQRQRTKSVSVSKGVFNETFSFIHMTRDLIETCGIRLRVYGTQRFSKRLIGEVKLPLSQVDLVSPLSDEQIWKYLRPKGLVVSLKFLS